MTDVAKIGRPTKFNDQLQEIMMNMSEMGYTDKEIANLICIDESTLTNWKKKYPDFFASLKEAKGRADCKVEQALFKSALGEHYIEEHHEGVDANGNIVDKKVKKQVPPNSTSQLFWLKNRQPDKYRDRKEVEHSGSVGIEQVLDKLDEQDDK